VSSLACTYCSAPKRKDPGLLPASQRYLSARIATLHAAGPLAILSGEYGLLKADTPIPWYDHLLKPDEVSAMVPRVTSQLRDWGITTVIFHTADPAQVSAIRPYVAVMKRACVLASVTLHIAILAGDPP